MSTAGSLAVVILVFWERRRRRRAGTILERWKKRRNKAGLWVLLAGLGKGMGVLNRRGLCHCQARAVRSLTGLAGC